ncbi:diphthine--ammonia ligase [Desulfurococcaceae archaeon MEX13E-LK6-19]|nr:diphthine--ammonia ligase [Desulfurococcaceae archaeon MEX13E-LK6-19]
MKKAAALYTGGKDSHYAVIEAIGNGIEVVVLVVATPRRSDSWMFHTVNIKWTKLHAEALGIPIEYIDVSGVKEDEVMEFYNGFKNIKEKYGIDTIVTGAVASLYQKKRVDIIAEKLGLNHYAPLWGTDQEQVLRREIEKEEFIITAVQAYGLTSKWLGKSITKENIEEFLSLCRKYKLSPVGEGGEIETFVIDSVIMKKRVMIKEYEKKWFPAGYGYLVIRDAVLIDKN